MVYELLVSYAGYSVNVSSNNIKLGKELIRQLSPIVSITERNGVTTNTNITILSYEKEYPIPDTVSKEIQVDYWNKGNLWEFGAKRVIKLPEEGVVFEINREMECIGVFHSHFQSLVEGVVRAIKVIFISMIESEGKLHLHGSSVELEKGKAVLFLGASGSGKSTLLLECLTKSNQASLISCDMLIIGKNMEDLEITGFPTPFNFCLGTLACYPQLFHFFPPHARHLSYNELWSVRAKESLNISDVTESLGVPVKKNSKVGCIVFPKFDVNSKPFVSRISSKEEIMNCMNDVYVGSRYYPDWTGLLPAIPRQSTSQIIADLSEFAARSVPVYKLSWVPSLEDLLMRIPMLKDYHISRSELLANIK